MSFCSYGQLKKVDSLKTILSKTKDPHKVIVLCDAINKEFLAKKDFKSSAIFIDSIKKYAQTKANSSFKASIYKLKGDALKIQMKLNEAILVYKKGLKIVDTNNVVFANINHNIGGVFLNKRQLDSAFYYYNSSKITYLKLNNAKGLTNANYNLASINFYTNNLFEAEQNLRESLKYNLISKNLFTESQSYLMLAQMNILTNNTTLGLENLNKALVILEKIKNYDGIFQAKGYIASLYHKDKKYALSETAFENTKLYFQTKKLSFRHTTMVFFINYTSFLVEQKMNKKSKMYLDMCADEIKQKTQFEYYKPFLTTLYAKYLLNVNKPKLAYAELEKINPKLLPSDALIYYYESKSKVYKVLKQYEKALKFNELHHKLNDSIYNEGIQQKLTYTKSKYESKQKENKILTLTNETQEKELALQKSKSNTSMALGGLFLFIVGGGFYIKKRKKDQKLKLLEQSVKSSEQEKIRIGKELHDGIASDLRLLAHSIEDKDVALSHKLLDSYNEIRDLSHQLNNTPMHGELFMDRIFELVPENTAKQVFNIQINPAYLELTEPYSTHLYRIIQELFTNNIKYAKASETTINISEKDDFLTISYTDNGVGTLELKKGNGLKSIEDRVTLLNGVLEIDAKKGFNVSIKFPYKN